WTKLNSEIIPGSLDTVLTTEYHEELYLPGRANRYKKIGIAAVDIKGEEERHGPYTIGRVSGKKFIHQPINWKSIHDAISEKRAEKQAAWVKKWLDREEKPNPLVDQTIYLSVDREAVYKVSHETLMAQGIDLRGVETDHIALTFKGEPVARPIDANGNPVWGDESTLTFKGRAPEGENALYISENLYRLSVDRAHVLSTDEITPLYTRTARFENNRLYSYSLPQEDPFYDTFFYASGTRNGTLTRTFTLPALGAGVSTLTFYLSEYTEGEHALTISVNGTELYSYQSDGRDALVVSLTVDNGLFLEGENSVDFTIPGRSDIFDMFIYDKTVVEYSVEEGVESMVPKVVVRERVDSDRLSFNDTPNYLIIAHPLFINATLDRYIQRRESQGWKTVVADLEDVYELYGHGMATPEGIKALILEAQQHGVTHVQLIGASNYDYHNYLNTGAISLIPSPYTLTSEVVTHTPTDNYFVAGQNELPELAIGRWPVRTEEDLEKVVDKTFAWEDNGVSEMKTALLMADVADRDAGETFDPEIEVIGRTLEGDGWGETTRIYLEEFLNGDAAIESEEVLSSTIGDAKELMRDRLAAGMSITTYGGHSSTTEWSFEGLLDQDEISAIENIGMPTLALPVACFATYADTPYTNTIAHQLLVEGENGAVAVFGSSTRTDYSYNGVMINGVVKRLLSGDTLGEAVMQTKRTLNTQQYKDVIRSGNLIGDVTLQLN
ncbi:MAG TPA: hypothetical protein ENK72_02645, partial [Epsilonproteobacteria bacterium]|nr:hypothetical protein [Campylobacterota bacterium]